MRALILACGLAIALGGCSAAAHQSAPSGTTRGSTAADNSQARSRDGTPALPAHDVDWALAPAASDAAPPTSETGVSPSNHKGPKQWIAEKHVYRPTADGFPQIIQGDDVEAISAIQSFYSSVLGSTQLKPFGHEDQVECASDGRSVVIKSKKRTVEVSIYEDSVTIAGRAYSGASTTAVFSALARLLADLSGQFQHEGVRGTRYRNSTYKDVTVTEFSYPPLVVSLSSLSNGTTNPDRLYVLDLIDRNDSLFWH